MQTGKNLDYVDAMRGIAILMVILVHTSQNIKIESELISLFCRYGQMGVQLFFVASAFTLCNSAENRNNEPNKILGNS
jgi:peptidoglycan/LPS O-acetylase OafA/YrhL